jgi:hypothetical protein
MRKNAIDQDEMFRAHITYWTVDTVTGDTIAGPWTNIAGPYSTKGTAKGVITGEVNQMIRTNEHWENMGQHKRMEFDVFVERAEMKWVRT